ncbi:MAG: response regulator, partial [Desulfobacterales bacterium]|nr:response regulator [Desulfobacterales bacterium]
KELEAARDRIAAQLDQAQKMESIGTLAGGIAHDFNNILFPIIGYAEMMVQDVRENSIARNSAIEILKASNRAKELVQQILVFSRQRDHEKEPLWLQPILKEALKLLRATLPATIAIRTEIDDNCGSVLADPTQIHQIIMNLCTNAYHAMRETGGELVVKLNTIDIASGYLSSSQSGVDTGTNLELVISDTGSGMDKEVLERMFEPYYTTKKIGEGTGMGLSMVHGIVQAHNGHIVVDSELGKGTTFRIYLPRIVEDAVQQPVISNLKLPGGDESLLIVDDEAPIIRMEQEMLERLGYTVEGLTSSVEALSLFRESPDKYKLVITDQTMPELTGAELAAELLALRPALPIILCTGFSESITEKNALEIGIKKFIMKPIVINDLAKTVRDALDGKL